jgi:hypothetical protein
VLGSLVMGVGSFLPFQTTYYIHGQHFIAGELQRPGVRFRKDANAFLWTDGPQALQAAADRLSTETIRRRLDYWTLVRGPKFSKKDRADHPLASRLTRCTRSSTVGISSSDAMFPSTRSSSVPGSWEGSA